MPGKRTTNIVATRVDTLILLVRGERVPQRRL